MAFSWSKMMSPSSAFLFEECHLMNFLRLAKCSDEISVRQVCLKSMWVTGEPTENNGTICPRMNFAHLYLQDYLEK